MVKKILIFLFIVFFIFFNFSCGSSGSTSNSNIGLSNFPFITQYSSTMTELKTAASAHSFASDSYYDDIFDNENGILVKFQYYLNLWNQFINNAEYDPDQDLWIVVLPDPPITLYGEYTNRVLWIYSPDDTDLNIYIYTGEGAMTLDDRGTPDSTNPHVRAELYKSGDYYYGFILVQDSFYSADMVKFKYYEPAPTYDFRLEYGSFESSSSTLVGAEFKSEINAPPPIYIYEYEFIRDRTETADSWYDNSDDIYPYRFLFFDEGTFYFSIPMVLRKRP